MFVPGGRCHPLHAAPGSESPDEIQDGFWDRIVDGCLMATVDDRDSLMRVLRDDRLLYPGIDEKMAGQQDVPDLAGMVGRSWQAKERRMRDVLHSSLGMIMSNHVKFQDGEETWLDFSRHGRRDHCRL